MHTYLDIGGQNGLGWPISDEEAHAPELDFGRGRATVAALALHVAHLLLGLPVLTAGRRSLTPARLDTARHGSARRGAAQARHGTARLGSARLGTARHGSARHGTARHGSARHGLAWRGS